jgi:hypothetical protein
MNREKGASGFAFGKRETFAGLLNVNANLARKILKREPQLKARVQIESRHHRYNGQRHYGKPDS